MARNILNFKKDQEYRINSVNIIDGMLFFTDNNSEPKRIELDTFRNADHSSGTTVVFGREFKERDITVIRPQPIEPLQLGIFNTPDNTDDEHDDGVPPVTSKPPSVITVGTEGTPTQTTARILGRVEANSAAIQSKGFYYIKQEAKPTETEIRNNGTKVDATGTANFYADLSSLTAGSRYWYVAYAYNGINEIVVANNIEWFFTDKLDTGNGDDSGDEISDPVLVTQPIQEQDENGILRFKGTVTDNGGSEIINSGFLIVLWKPFNDYSKPSTLVNYTTIPALTKTSTRLVYNVSSMDAYLDNFPNGGGDNVWAQFWIERRGESGRHYANNVVELKNTYTPAQPVIQNDYVWVQENGSGDNQTLDLYCRAQIKQIDPNAEIKEAGVYFMDTVHTSLTVVKNIYENQPAGSRGIWKVKWTGLNQSTWQDEFTLNENDNTEFSIEYGKRYYVMSYLEQKLANGSTLSAYDVGFAELAKPEVKAPPLVVTEVLGSNNNSTLVCQGRVTGGSGTIEAIGFYLFKQENNEFKDLDLLSDQAKTKMLDLYTQGRAERFIFTDGGGGNSTARNTSYVKSFSSTQIVKVEEGGVYVGMAFANNSDGFESHGQCRIHGVPVQPDPLDIYGLRLSMEGVVADGDPGASWTPSGEGQIFRFKFLGPRNEDWPDIENIGFEYRNIAEADFSFGDSSNSDVNYSTSGVTVKTGRTLAKHESWLQNDDDNSTEDDRYVDLFVPMSNFSSGYGTVWSVQGYVKFSGIADKIKTTYEHGTQNYAQQGIVTFKPIDPSPHDYSVPIMSLHLDTTRSGSLSRANYSNIFFYANIKKASDNPDSDVINARRIYIVKKSLINGDADEPIDVVNSAIARGIVLDGNTVGSDEFIPLEGNPHQSHVFTNDPALELDPDTEYRAVAAAQNNSTQTSPVTGATAAGWGYSFNNPSDHSGTLAFKTAPQRVYVAWEHTYAPSETVTNYKETILKAKFQGTTAPEGPRTLQAYVVKASNIGSNPTHDEILADADTVSYNMLVKNDDNQGNYVDVSNRSGLYVFWYIRDLDDDTEYWVTFESIMQGIANEEGRVKHLPYKITTGPEPKLPSKELYLINDSTDRGLGTQLEFTHNGHRFFPKQYDLIEFHDGTDPEEGFFLRLGYFPSNAQIVGMFRSGNTILRENLSFRIYTDQFEGPMINIRCKANHGNNGNLGVAVLRLFHQGSYAEKPYIDISITQHNISVNSGVSNSVPEDDGAVIEPVNVNNGTNPPQNTGGMNNTHAIGTGGGLVHANDDQPDPIDGNVNTPYVGPPPTIVNLQ